MEPKVLRHKLIIKSVGEPKTIGKGTKLEFKAVLQGKDDVKDYESWSKTFNALIKEGATIEADIEYSEKESGDQIFRHRKVVEIYQDGKPVAKQKGGYSGGPKRDEDRTDARTAVMCITELWKDGKIEEKDPLVIAARAWFDGAIGITRKTVKEK